MLEAYAAMFEKSVVLKNCPEGMRRMLALKVKTVLYLAGERVVPRGHLCDTTYYVYRGAVQVRDPSGSNMAQLSQG